MNFFNVWKLGRTLLMLTAVVVVGLLGCGGGDNPSGGNDNGGNDTPGGNNNPGGGTTPTYNNTCGQNGTANSCNTVTIGGKTWMAENLNYQTDNSWCYKNADSNCVKYGKLYTWDAAMIACPTGWHLASISEWHDLVMTAGGYSTAGSKLKATNGWKSNGNGTNDYGFSALPGGTGHQTSDYFSSVDFRGYWWTALEYDGVNAYGMVMSSFNDSVEAMDRSDKRYVRSVRCVQN
jgi:uncharacterized protein (TIGR02145 family)